MAGASQRHQLIVGIDRLTIGYTAALAVKAIYAVPENRRTTLGDFAMIATPRCKRKRASISDGPTFWTPQLNTAFPEPVFGRSALSVARRLRAFQSWRV